VRDYPINPNACIERFSHFIPLESNFILDRRGNLELLQVPDVP